MKNSRNTLLITLIIIIISGISLVVFLVRTNPGKLEKYIAQLEQLLQSKKKDLTALVASRPRIDREVIYRYGLARISSSGGLQDLNNTDRYVEGTNPAQAGLKLQSDQMSNYQAYVTPNDPAVQAVAKGRSYEAIYQKAVSWVWAEDAVLHGVQDKWLSPNSFLTQSPKMASNPIKGSPASDCEEQAYTLVSALRSAGMLAEDVRVATGQVDFGGSVGGHAWVEVFDKATNSWFELEPTSGNYYDSASGKYYKSSGLPYTFFKTYRYPAVQIWGYFNDKYFWDNSRQEGNVAQNWLTTETIARQAPQSEVVYELPQNVQTIREERVRQLQREIDSLNEQELKNQIEQLRRMRKQQESSSESSQRPGENNPEPSEKVAIEEQQGEVAIVGKVEKIEAGTITISTSFGELAMTLSPNTPISSPPGATVGSIKLGMTIMVEGQQEGEDRIQIETIQIIQ